MKCSLYMSNICYSSTWKDSLRSSENINLVVQEHHPTRKHQIFYINRLNTKLIDNILIASNDSKKTTSSPSFFPQNSRTDWKSVYMFPTIIMKDSWLRIFQYKLLNNVLYLNKIPFRFAKINLTLCSFCKLEDETTLDLFAITQKQNICGTN